MDFDFKITMWERVEIPEELQDEALKLVREGKVQSAQDIFEYFEGFDLVCEKIDGTDEQMTLEDNKGASTIEVLDDTNILYENGY